MPRVIMIAAQSLDGFITRHDESGTGFCSEADANFFRNALRDFDSLIIGRRTFDTLQDLIVRSRSTQYLRKVVTRAPDRYRDVFKPELIEFTAADPKQVVAELAERGRLRCALLGGSDIYSQYLAADLVDELWLTLEPFVFGRGTPLASGTLRNRFELKSSEQLAPSTLLLRYGRARES